MSKESKKLPIKQIEELAKIFKENNLEELFIDTKEFSLKFSKNDKKTLDSYVLSSPSSVVIPTPTQQSLQQSLQTQHVQQPQKETTQSEFDDETRYHKVKSPITGTFYRSPAPGSEPFVKEGDHVNSGQTLCIVEAMKVMNEIKSSVSGKVVKICKNNAEVVKSDDVLMIIEMV